MVSNPNLVKIHWEFDIESDESLQRDLGLTSREVEDMQQDPDETNRLHRLCCTHLGVPMWVDLDLFFDEPREVSDYQITDALSDEHGWLIKSWEWQDDA